MDEVARRAHVGRATLYKHFPGRDALIGAVVQTELAKSSPRSNPLSSDTSTRTSVSWLRPRLSIAQSPPGRQPNSPTQT